MPKRPAKLAVSDIVFTQLGAMILAQRGEIDLDLRLCRLCRTRPGEALSLLAGEPGRSADAEPLDRGTRGICRWIWRRQSPDRGRRRPRIRLQPGWPARYGVLRGLAADHGRRSAARPRSRRRAAAGWAAGHRRPAGHARRAGQAREHAALGELHGRPRRPSPTMPRSSGHVGDVAVYRRGCDGEAPYVTQYGGAGYPSDPPYISGPEIRTIPRIQKIQKIQRSAPRWIARRPNSRS